MDTTTCSSTGCWRVTMSRLQKLSLYVFCVFVVLSIALSYLMGATLFEKQDKPWHMLPFTDADSLTAEYTDSYELLGRQSLFEKFGDSTRTTVVVLVDAWGVPFEPQFLREDFAVFNDVSHKEYLHRRLANRSRHAEFSELRINRVARNSAELGDSVVSSGIYLFGGDSLEYGRNLYIDSLGYGERLFCQKCPDSVMAIALDSVLSTVAGDSASPVKHIAWTTQDSRDGDRAKLHATLGRIADVARRHPEVRFIVQGTHRPTLGDPKIRRESFTHWVPAIVLN